MKETVGLIFCLILYTGTMMFFGGWIEWKIIQVQVPKWSQQYWSDGCKQCASYEKAMCDRDQLQGVPKHEEIPQ